MKRIIFFMSGIIISISAAFGQGVAINETGSTAHSSAMLDVSSTESGLLIPRVTLTQRNAIFSPATGLLVYQTTNTPGFYYYDGSSWKLVGSGSLGIDDLSDGVSAGNSVFLGIGAGLNDDRVNNLNIGLGVEALYDNISGIHNVAIGYRALYNSTVDNNHAVGYRALFTNSTGVYNTASGFQALYGNTTGNNNTAVGYNSSFYNTTGASNTASGCNALYRNTTGNYNVGIGYYANAYNEEGSNNTIIGYQAGRGGTTLHSKSGNVFIGYNAGYSDTTDNKLYIENSSTSSPLIYGEFDNNLLRINGTLHIGSVYHFPTSDGTSGQVLATDGSGTIGWTTVTTGGGPTALNDLTDAKTGGGSVFLGADAGASDNGIATKNIALGQLALYSNDDGKYNAALGYEALNQNITGDYNVALGYQALYTSTASRHTAVGHNALYYNSTGESNTAFGHYAGRNNSTGNYNTLIGYNANLFNQTGSNNTLLGYKAGQGTALHSKSGNVFLGYEAGYSETASNKLYIENSSSSTPLIWGDFDADSVRINGDLIVTGVLHGYMGIDDLYDGITTSSSVFLGEAAGSNDDGTDNKNTALGYHALENATGESNTALGFEASKQITTGNYNVAIGNFANGGNTGGEKNICIGNNAGYRASAHSKTGNIFIGYSAGYNALTNNKLYIENSTSSTPLIWGDFDADSVMINGDFGVTGTWVGIGLDDLYDGRVASHSIFLGNGAGMYDDGYFQNQNVAVGDSALVKNNTGDDCTAVGFRALYSNYSSNNTAIGSGALESNTSGDENTAAGAQALHFNTTGDNNTAFGYRSLEDNLTGYDNTALGRMSLANNSTGHGNTALGAETMSINSTGNYNTAVGLYSMLFNSTGYDNTAMGNYSMTYNSTGYHNSAVGDSALLSNSEGFYNTANGAHALSSNTTGFLNTAIGFNALNSNTDDYSNTAVGGYALYVSDNGSGNTAMGTYALYSNHSYGNTAIGFQSQFTTDDGSSNTAVGTYSLAQNVSGDLNTSLGSSSSYWTTGSHNTHIGSFSGPDETHGNISNTSVLGYNVDVSSSNRVCIGNTSITWIGGQVTWSTYSDERMKENIREDVRGLDFIMKLRPVTYHVNKDRIDKIIGVEDKSDYPEKYDIEKTKQSGFLAQEVEQAAIESGYDFSGLHAPVNDNTPYSISYSEFVVPLVKAVQEQQETIEELRREIEELKNSATKD